MPCRQQRFGTNKGWCHTTIEPIPTPTVRRVSSWFWFIWVDFVKLDLHQVIGIVKIQLLVTGCFLCGVVGGGCTRFWRNRSRRLIVTNKQNTCQSCLLASTRSHLIIGLYIIMWSKVRARKEGAGTSYVPYLWVINTTKKIVLVHS